MLNYRLVNKDALANKIDNTFIFDIEISNEDLKTASFIVFGQNQTDISLYSPLNFAKCKF